MSGSDNSGWLCHSRKRGRFVHTSIRLGGFYYYGTNESNCASGQFGFGGTIKDPFYRAGADLRFKYRNMELFGVGMIGHDSNHIVDQGAQTINAGPAVKY